MRHRPLSTGALLIALALAGCGPHPGPAPHVTTAADRAAAVAQAWMESPDRQTWESGYYPLDLNQSWQPAFTSAGDKASFAAGALALKAALPPDEPGTATVVWADGSSLGLPLLGAATTFQGLTHGGPPCPGRCSPIPVTAVHAGTHRIATSRGQATIPVWEFTLAGYSEPVVRPAVASQQKLYFVPSPGPADGLGAGWTGVSPDGRTLHGVVDLGCYRPKTTEVYETDQVVVPILHARPLDPPCPGTARTTPFDFHLARPLGRRTVLNLFTARPQAPLDPSDRSGSAG